MRRALLHVGTHKTGTTSIQAFLQDNACALTAAGVYVPHASRHQIAANLVTPGHHDLAWDLMGDRKGALQRVIDEVATIDAPTIVLSSEELHLLHTHPERLASLHQALAKAGFETTIVVYLREQAGYLASLFSEIAKKNSSWRFVDFLNDAYASDAVIANPQFPIPLRYSRLLSDFSTVFGAEHVIARPYVGSNDPHALLRDFLRVVAAIHGPIALANLRADRAIENTRLTFADVLMQIYAFVNEQRPGLPEPFTLAAWAGVDPRDPMLGARFSPIRHADKVAIVRHFAADSAATEARCSITIPGTREAEIPGSTDASWRLANAQRPFLDFALDAWFK